MINVPNIAYYCTLQEKKKSRHFLAYQKLNTPLAPRKMHQIKGARLHTSNQQAKTLNSLV